MLRRWFLVLLIAPFLVFFDCGLLYDQWNDKYQFLGPGEWAWQCFSHDRRDNSGEPIPRYVQIV